MTTELWALLIGMLCGFAGIIPVLALIVVAGRKPQRRRPRVRIIKPPKDRPKLPRGRQIVKR